jgi:hypothetical protein
LQADRLTGSGATILERKPLTGDGTRLNLRNRLILNESRKTFNFQLSSFNFLLSTCNLQPSTCNQIQTVSYSKSPSYFTNRRFVSLQPSHEALRSVGSECFFSAGIPVPASGEDPA